MQVSYKTMVHNPLIHVAKVKMWQWNSAKMEGTIRHLDYRCNTRLVSNKTDDWQTEWGTVDLCARLCRGTPAARVSLFCGTNFSNTSDVKGEAATASLGMS